MTPPVVLTIAGSDSGGGAGIQADLATFHAHSVHGCTAISALTAQNTYEVRGVLATPPEFLLEQIETVLDDLGVVAVKTGMLATIANVHVVVDLARAGRLPNLVVDPVMVSSSGSRLLEPDAETAYRKLLLPLATVFTPNCREAAVLLGWDEPITTVARQRDAARILQQEATSAGVVIVKGGDLDHDPHLVVDVHAGPGWLTEAPHPRIATANNHGTGCSFASAITANLALGHDVSDAVDLAIEFVQRGLAAGASWHLGAGHGPIHHRGAQVGTPHPLAHPAPSSTGDVP